MKNRRRFLAVAGLTVAFGLSAAFAAQDTSVKAKIGEAAPAFELPNLKGETVKLEDHKGNIVVLQWVNPGCPVCVRVMSTGVEKKMLDELKAIDENVVVLAVSTTRGLAADKVAAYLADNNIEIDAVIDADGAVGKAYGARTTPHMYVIDADGVLRYQGAIDDDQRGGNDSATNYVVNAVKQIKAGETVEPSETKPYGCNVKY
jgi:peroxiredoxin